MQNSLSLRTALSEVGQAIRRPEQLALRWQDSPDRSYLMLLSTLLANAAFGAAAYGVTMQMHHGLEGMVRGAIVTPLAGGVAWLMALPALYIFNSALGARLGVKPTALAASITVCFGAWAMLAAVPVNWFFTLAAPYDLTRILVNLLVFCGVGLAMADVFLRVLKALEPERTSGFGYVWLALVGVIGAELFYLFGAFEL